jgi:predicted cupin superfamily sugar epimerase
VSRAAELIDRLELRPHPEGGHYRQVYAADETIPAAALPERFVGDRPYATSIYYLLAGGERSRLHRIASDELWHFYAGTPLTIVTLDDAGDRRDLQLGADLAAGERYQRVVPAGLWFGASLREPAPDAFALVGCTVAPGFDFAEFELADAAALRERFPQHADVIERLG